MDILIKMVNACFAVGFSLVSTYSSDQVPAGGRYRVGLDQQFEIFNGRQFIRLKY